MTPSTAEQTPKRQASPDSLEGLRTIFANLAPLLKGAGMEETAGSISGLFERAARSSFAVLLCGEFKRGKSSLVNALLGSNLCPVDDCITTATVSLFRYGTSPRATRHFPTDSNPDATETVDAAAIEQYVKNASPLAAGTTFLDIEMPCDSLRSGVCLIDTPGIGGLEERHLALTTLALAKADCIFFVADAGEPLSASETAFIKDKIIPFGASRLNIVLNKADLVDPETAERLCRDIRTKVERECRGVNVNVIPVSSQLWELYRLTGDENFRDESNLLGLNNAMSEMRKEHRLGLLRRIRMAIIDAAETLKQNLADRLAAMKDPSPARIEALQLDGKAVALEKREIENPSSKFNRELNGIIERTQNEVMTRLTNDTVILSSSGVEKVYNECKVKKSEKLQAVVDELNRELETLVTELNAMIEAGFETVLEKARVEFTRSAPEPTPGIDADITLNRQNMSEKIFSTARNSIAGLGVFSAMSLIGGMVASSAIIMPIAAFGALMMAWKSVAFGAKTANKTEIIKQVQPRLTIAINELRGYVQSRFKEFSQLLRDSLLSVASEMEGRLLAIRKDLEACAEESKKFTAEKAVIEKQIAYVDATVKHLSLQMTNPFVKNSPIRK